MAKRYYICRVIGDGTHETPYNSELRQYIQTHFGIKFLKQAIHPNALMWAIMKYDLTQDQHDEVMANVPQLFSFPQGVLDRELSEIDPARRLAIKTKLESIGFDFDWATLTNTVRDVLKYLFHSIQLASWAKVPITNKNFDMNTIVSDIPIAKRQLIAGHMQDLGIDTSWITPTHTVNDVVTKIMFHSDSSPRLFGTIKRRQWFWHDEDSE